MSVEDIVPKCNECSSDSSWDVEYKSGKTAPLCDGCKRSKEFQGFIEDANSYDRDYRKN